MAFTGQTDQYALQSEVRPNAQHTEIGAKRKATKFSYTYDQATTDSLTVDLCKLPAGPVHVLALASRLTADIASTTTTVDIGHRAYVDRVTGAVVPANPNALVDGVTSVLGAAGVAWGSGDGSFAGPKMLLLDSAEGVELFATVADGDIVEDDVISGYVGFISGQ